MSIEEVKKAEDHPFGSKDKADRELTLILVSDLHYATDKLEKLKNWYVEKNKERINYVIGLGDFDNLDNDDPDTQKELPSKLESNISNELLYLEFFSVPILYIPGNHDAPSLFSEKPTLTQHSVNIHGTAYKLAEGLQIVGFGGSLPGYNKDKQIWAGWPFKSDVELATKFKEIAQSQLNSSTQTILATHVGPWSSSTTKDYFQYFPDLIDSGSKYLDEVIIKEENNILTNLHGHTHEGTGRANLRRKEVINPGSLMQGNFGILRLNKDSWTQKWVVKSLELISLDSM